MSLLYQPDRALESDERKLVIPIRHHWAIMAPVMATVIPAIFVLVAVNDYLVPDSTAWWLVRSVLWYGQIGALGVFAWKLLSWWHNVVLMTNLRIMRVEGIVHTTAQMVPSAKIQDYERKDNLLGHLLGYAHFRIESAGRASLQQLSFIPQPDEVEAIISKLVLNRKLPATKESAED